MNRAAILVLLLMAGPAFGHDIYKDWKAQSGASCCSERKEHPSRDVTGDCRDVTGDCRDVTGDCRPVRAVQDMNGNWIAYENGKPFPIPDHAIRPIKSPDGRSHLCEMHGHVFCFVPGEVRS